MLWGVKNVKLLTIACVQAVGNSFFQIYFIFSASIGGYDVSPPYLFFRPGVKIMLWGVQTLKILTCNLKTIAFREFCLNMSFSYFWVSYNIVKLLTCSSLHS